MSSLNVDNEKITKVKKMSIAFNENEFLFIFNPDESGIKGGEIFSVPVHVLKEMTNGMIQCGNEYQKTYQKNIGFKEE